MRVSSLVFASILLAALANPASAVSREEQAAKRVCECLEQPYSKYAEVIAAVKKAQATGNFGAMMKLQGEMVAQTGAIDACYAKLEKDFSDFAKDQKKIDEINAMAEKECPNPGAEFMK